MVIAESAAAFRDTPAGSMIIVLLTAAAVAMVMQRLRLAVIPAYLVAGAIVGPGALGFVSDPHALEFASELAIVLLMFGIGLHMDVASLRRDARRLLSAGLGGVVVVSLALWPTGLLVGLGAPAALAVAMAMAMSSTAVVLRLMASRGDLTQVSGRLALAVLVLQDLAVIAVVAIIPLLGMWAGTAPDAAGAEDGASPLWARVMVRFGAVVLLVVGGKILLPLMLREAAREKTGEVMIVLSVAVAVGASALMQALGLSRELGAFLSGFLLSSTSFKHQLSGQIGPARDLLIAVFFTTVGMMIDPGLLVESWPVVLAATAVVIVVKAAAQGLACWAVGATAATAAIVGCALSQAGEFSLVVMRVAQSNGLLSVELLALATAVVGLSLIVTPGLLAAGRAIGRRLADAPPAPWLRMPPLGAPEKGAAGAGDGRPHVIIGGFGPVGRAVADHLVSHHIDYTIVEMNPATVRAQAEMGRRIVYGDAGNAEVLESAGLHGASALVLTVPDDDAILRATALARAMVPGIFIAARTSGLSRAHLAWGLGANQVITDEVACADAMRRAVLMAIEQDAGYASTAGRRPK